MVNILPEFTGNQWTPPAGPEPGNYYEKYNKRSS
jgi:hypothetical protein